MIQRMTNLLRFFAITEHAIAQVPGQNLIEEEYPTPEHETFAQSSNPPLSLNGASAPTEAEIPPVVDLSEITQIVDSMLFFALQSLDVHGSFSLIEQLVAKVSSCDLRAQSIDFTPYLELIQMFNSLVNMPMAVRFRFHLQLLQHYL